MRCLGVVLSALLVLAGASTISGGEGTAATARLGPSRAKAAVYFVLREHVAPVRRLVAGAAPARGSLTALLAGPTSAERQQGYSSAIPSGARLRGVSLSRGVLTVDLSPRFQTGGGSESMLLRIAQIVYTATAFPNVDRVAFRLGGKPVSSIGGEGVVVRPPVGRSAFEAQAPRILVEQPLPATASRGSYASAARRTSSRPSSRSMSRRRRA